MTEICLSGFITQSVSKLIYGTPSAPEMVAPKALVFWLLIKWNEESGNEIYISLKENTSALKLDHFCVSYPIFGSHDMFGNVFHALLRKNI